MIYCLAACFLANIHRFGEMEDFERIIELHEELGGVPGDDADRAFSLLNYSIGCLLKYIKSGHIVDLHKAIQICQEALGATSEGDGGRAPFQYFLGLYYSLRFDRAMDWGDKVMAEEMFRESLAAIESDSPTRAAMLTHQSEQLVAAQKMPQSEIVSGILAAKKRADTEKLRISIDDPHRTGAFHLISFMLQAVHDSIVEAIKYQGYIDNELTDPQQAILDALASDFVVKIDLDKEVKLLVSTLCSLSLITEHEQRLEAFNYQLDLLLEAWHCENSPPRHRIRAAHLAAQHLASLSGWDEGSALLHGAVQILPQLTPQFLARDDQQYELSKFTDLASNAASVALQAGEAASHCLGILELGRGVIMGLAINYRSDVSELQTNHPDISDRFNLLRLKMDSPLVGKGVDNLTHEGQRQRRVEVRKLMNSWSPSGIFPDSRLSNLRHAQMTS